MPVRPTTLGAISKRQLETLERLAEHGGVDRLKKVYDQAAAALEDRLARIAGRGGSPFTPAQLKAYQVQIRQGQIAMAKKLSGGLKRVTRETQIDAVRTFAAEVGRMEKAITGMSVPIPVDEVARLAGVIDKRRSSMLKLQRSSVARYTGRVIGKMENELAVSLASGETTGAAIDRIQRVSDTSWYQAERIVRTEQAYAFNATHADVGVEMAEELPDLMMRWTEHVSDSTGMPLDRRVGADSIAMHGQLATPGELFTMPPAPGVSIGLIGQSWAHPPNRPNDRAVLQPWRPGWGIPGWVYRGGRKIPKL